MKRMIVSDIHGSYPNLKRVLHWLKEWKVEQLILLGDILYHGPRNDLPEGYNPKLCIEELNQYKDIIVCVRGNCDSEVDQMVLAFPIMADYALIYEGKQTMFFTHGHVFNEQVMPKLKKQDIFVSGHTHIPVMHEANGIHLLNPGSISIPKGEFAASFGFIEDGIFQLMSLDGICMASYACK